jgi:hypothetical protein
MARSCVLPDPLCDIRAQVVEMRAGRKKIVYVSGDRLPDVGEDGFAVVPVEGDGEHGHTVLPENSVAQYLTDVHNLGLADANAQWLGYQESKRTLLGRNDLSSVRVMRGDCVIHDELVAEPNVGTAMHRLRRRFPGAAVVTNSIVETLQDRINRMPTEEARPHAGLSFWLFQ